MIFVNVCLQKQVIPLIFVTLAHLDSWKNVLKENKKEEKVMKKLWVCAKAPNFGTHPIFCPSI